MSLYDQYPTISVDEGDTAGADVLEHHPNVFEFRRGPGQVLFLKFFDPAFARVRELGAMAEVLDPAAWAANAKALEEWRRLLAGTPGGPGLIRNQVRLSESYEVLSRRNFYDSGVRFFVSDPSAPTHALIAKARSQLPRVEAFIKEVASTLDSWLKDNSRGGVVTVECTKNSFEVKFEVRGQRPLDAGIAGLTLLCTSNDIQKLAFRAPAH